jgi:hypothetical protein
MTGNEGLLIEKLHFIKALDPIADALAGTVRTDVVNLKEYGKLVFLIHKGVGATGTSTITIEGSDDNSPSNVTAVPFHYRAITSTDVPGSVTAATTAGFALTAGSSQMYAIEVNAEDLIASGYNYVSMKAVEVVNSPVLAGILAMGADPRYGATSVERTALS